MAPTRPPVSPAFMTAAFRGPAAEACAPGDAAVMKRDLVYNGVEGARTHYP
jgi:hypothetical protein